MEGAEETMEVVEAPLHILLLEFFILISDPSIVSFRCIPGMQSSKNTSPSISSHILYIFQNICIFFPSLFIISNENVEPNGLSTWPQFCQFRQVTGSKFPMRIRSIGSLVIFHISHFVLSKS